MRQFVSACLFIKCRNYTKVKKKCVSETIWEEQFFFFFFKCVTVTSSCILIYCIKLNRKLTVNKELRDFKISNLFLYKLDDCDMSDPVRDLSTCILPRKKIFLFFFCCCCFIFIADYELVNYKINNLLITNNEVNQVHKKQFSKLPSSSTRPSQRYNQA